MTREMRATTGSVSLREQDGGGAMTITGYAAKFYRADDPGTQYELWPGAVERIAPGAFDHAIAHDDVRALFNHDSSALLGRTKARTLTLTVDQTGLRYDIQPADTTVYRDVVAHLQRGDIDGSSFQFQIPPNGESWTRDGELEVRTITNVRLYDVGPVTFPAYQSSESGLRDAAQEIARRSHEDWHRRTQQQLQARNERATRLEQIIQRLVEIDNKLA